MDPYARIARIYEAEFGGLEADIAYHDRFAEQGPLLVLGCGTGRLGRAFAGRRRVVGLDVSAAMIETARASAPDATYVCADMRNFDVAAVTADGRFAEAIAPNGAFSFLATRSDQLACLERVRDALREDGTLVLDLPMPNFEVLGQPHTPEKPVWQGTVDGAEVRHTREAWRSPTAQRLTLMDRYYVDGTCVSEAPLELRWVFPAEAEWMCERAGFGVMALHGDYAGSPLSHRSPRLIVRAMPL